MSSAFPPTSHSEQCGVVVKTLDVLYEIHWFKYLPFHQALDFKRFLPNCLSVIDLKNYMSIISHSCH